MAAEYLCNAIDPVNPNGPKIDAIFPARYTESLFKYSPVDFQNLIAAKFVLENTKRIFYGVWEWNEGGWCYTGRPATWFVRNDRIEVPFPQGLVFAVYMNPRMHVYECRAERASSDDPFAPIDWETRYRGLTWKSTS